MKKGVIHSTNILKKLSLYGHLLRWNRPTGALLLFFPCLWGLTLGTQGAPAFEPMLLFFCGAILMRSAGCVYNDMVDRDLDAHVARTQDRPLASQQISFWEAGSLIFLLSFLSLSILLQFNTRTVLLGFLSLGLVLLYPWMKRITFWPQFFLGLAFNWGVWMGWASTAAPFTWSVLALYGVGILWTLAYDTIYAYQDYADDLAFGMKSSALKVGTYAKPFLALCWTTMLLLLGLTGWIEGFRLFYFMGLLLVAGHFLWQGWTLDIHNPENCAQRFLANRWVGLFIFLSLLAG